MPKRCSKGFGRVNGRCIEKDYIIKIGTNTWMGNYYQDINTGERYSAIQRFGSRKKAIEIAKKEKGDVKVYEVSGSFRGDEKFKNKKMIWRKGLK